MKNAKLAVASILVLSLAGCSTSQHPGTTLGSAKTDLAPPPANIPDAKEPAFVAETRFAAGQVDESQNNPGAAVVQYQEALKLSPNHLGSLYRLGVLYARLKNYPKAVDSWQRYISASGGAATAYGDLGFCEELAGDPAKAEAAYQSGIVKDEKNVPCRVNYGLMLARRGQINEAVVQWRFVLTEAEIHYNLGGIFEAQGNKNKARIEFTKALEMDPNLTDAKTRVAQLDQN